MTDRIAWLAERRKGLGGSDIQHIFNEEPYGCARRLFYDKRDEPKDFPEEETAIMQRGTRLEDLVAELYAERTGRTVEKRGSIVSETHPWARVSPDRAIVGDERGEGTLEIKTHNDWMFRRVKRDGLLTGHILQLQHALFVTGHAWGSYAILHPDSWSLLYFDVPRDDALIRGIIAGGERMWRTVEHGPAPDPLPTIDKRCRTCPWRTTCRGEELMPLPGDTEREMELERDDSLDPLLADYREAKQMADEAEETLDMVKESIRRHLGERRAVECRSGRVYYAPQAALRIDAAELRAKHPSIAKTFEKPIKSRPLRVYTA